MKLEKPRVKNPITDQNSESNQAEMTIQAFLTFFINNKFLAFLLTINLSTPIKSNKAA